MFEGDHSKYSEKSFLFFLAIRKIIVASLLLCSLGSRAFFQSSNSLASENLLTPTHREVPRAPDFDPINEHLLVALAQYLGKEQKFNDEATILNLRSAGKHLILKDANGLVHKSSHIRLAWRKKRFEKPKKVSRYVAGPFASFESAQRFASKLPINNDQIHIAHPLDWEVWISTGIDIPRDISFRKKEEEIFYEIQPVLIGRSTEILLKGPISIAAQDGLIWNEGVYFGPFALKPDAYGTWSFIENVALERYLEGVVPYEIGSRAPKAALSAQAVLARTWALANLHRFAIDGYHLCSNVQCQVYKNPADVPLEVRNAIKNTSGKILKWNNKPINAVYHATNGGVMAGGDEAWLMEPLPYFQSRLDGSINWNKEFSLPLFKNSAVKNLLQSTDGAYGRNHRLFRWKRIYTSKQLIEAIQIRNSRFEIEGPLLLNVLKRGPSGRVLALEIFDSNENSLMILRLDNIRRTLRELPSTLFVVNELKEGVWEFDGGGFGHGVGMSQAGAIELAYKGWDFQKILQHYYPGTKYGNFQY